MSSGPARHADSDNDGRDFAVGSPQNRRRAARAVLVALVLAVGAGLAVGYFAPPFLIFLYCQLAALGLSAFIIVRLRHSVHALPVFIAYLAAYALGLPVLATVLSGLFFLLLAGRSLITARFARTVFTTASFLAAGLGFLAYFLLSRMSTAPDPSLQGRFADVAAMEALPYQAFVEDEQHGDRSGVVTYDRKTAAAGLNLYNSYYQAGAVLLDMDGRPLHTWLPKGTNPQWHYVTLGGNGDLLICIEDTMIMRVDWMSRILWSRPLRAHHEIAVAPNGDIYTLASEDEKVVIRGLPAPIINDYIVVLAADGGVKKRLSVFDLLKDKVPSGTVGRIYGEIMAPRDFLWKPIKREFAGRSPMDRLSAFDTLHDNTISLADRDIPGVCAKGDVLISAKALDLIGVVDIARGAMRWTWGPGELQGQHDPTFLDNGNILIFDNGTEREYSRLVEFDPRMRTTVWEYHSLHPTLFYTSWGGSAQRLANGNTLVTESDDGRVFEITRDGRIVWEFLNPTKGADGKRSTIYRMTRITDPRMRDLLWKSVKAES
jgi:hypothetical protein